MDPPKIPLDRKLPKRNGRGVTKKRLTDYTRCAASFRTDEIELACTVFLGLLSGTDLSVLTKRPEYKAVLGKFERMRERMADKAEQLEQDRAVGEAPGSAEDI